MKNQLLTLLLMTVLLAAFSCDGSKKANAPGKVLDVWINSTYVQNLNGENAGLSPQYDVCYGVNYSTELPRDPMQNIVAEFEVACGTITGFDYELGNFYHLKVQEVKPSKKVSMGVTAPVEWKVLEVLAKEKDVHYERREVKTAWIGPEKMEARCLSPMTPPDCTELRHQAQFGELDRNGEWVPMYDFYEVPDFEEGYLYQVRYTKVYLSEFELNMLADHHGYRTEGLVVLSKEKY